MGKIGKEVKIGLSTYMSAFGIVFSRSLWWVFIVPLLLNILVFSVGNSYITTLSEQTIFIVKNYLDSLTDFQWLQSINTGFVFVLKILLNIIFYIVFIYTSGYVVMVLMSPLYSYVSEKTEFIVTGKQYSSGIKQFLLDIVRGVSLATKNFIIEILLTVVLIIVSFIPVLGWITPLCLILLASYFYGYSFMDYSLERRKMRLKESTVFIKNHKFVAIANGLVFTIMLTIPFCGVFLGAFFSLISVVAATLAIIKIENSENN